MTETISLKELVNLTDDEIRNRNPDEADDYIKARDALKPKKGAKLPEPSTLRVSRLEEPSVLVKPVKPKRKCSEKQLAALAAGRAKRAEKQREKAAAKNKEKIE